MGFSSATLDLLNAVDAGDAVAAARALDQGADSLAEHPNSVRGETLLHRILGVLDHPTEVSRALVTLLLQAGVPPNSVDTLGSTPASLMLQRIPVFNAQDQADLCAWIDELVALGFSFAGQDRHHSPVFSCYDRPKVLDAVLRGGGHLAQRDHHGDTPLLAFLREALHPISDEDLDLSWAHHLLDLGSAPDAVSLSPDQATPLTLLTLSLGLPTPQKSRLDLMRRLLDSGVDPNQGQALFPPQKIYRQWSHVWAPSSHEVNGPLLMELTPLHVAAAYLSVEAVELLLAAGADPNARTLLPPTTAEHHPLLTTMVTENPGLTTLVLTQLPGDARAETLDFSVDDTRREPTFLSSSSHPFLPSDFTVPGWTPMTMMCRLTSHHAQDITRRSDALTIHHLLACATLRLAAPALDVGTTPRPRL